MLELNGGVNVFDLSNRRKKYYLALSTDDGHNLPRSWVGRTGRTVAEARKGFEELVRIICGAQVDRR